MNTKLFCGAAALLAGSLLTAAAAPGDDLTNAVNSLAGQSGYSWKATVVVPEGRARFPPRRLLRQDGEGRVHRCEAEHDGQ